MAKILLIITGGIASYKSLYLIRLLRDRGCEVQPVLTKSATQFITPLSVSALAGNTAVSELFDLDAETNMEHIKLSRDADLICVAPCTANFMAKIALGLADDLASTVVLGSDKPLLIAPAMNPVMWDNPATRENVATLKQRKVHFVEPTSGDTACGELGIGRMNEPTNIFDSIANLIHANTTLIDNGDLFGKSFLITVGGTMEAIDPVRIITNRSSGKQGFAIAESLLSRGAKVTIAMANVSAIPPKGAIIKACESADEMLNICIEAMPVDGAIFCAAVADYKVANQQTDKHKKSDGKLQIDLTENKDILKTISNHSKRPKLVIGFGAETNNLIENASAKLQSKGCDMIVANCVKGDTFGGDNNTAYIIDNNGVKDLGTLPKTKLALILTDYIAQHLC